MPDTPRKAPRGRRSAPPPSTPSPAPSSPLDTIEREAANIREWSVMLIAFLDLAERATRRAAYVPSGKMRDAALATLRDRLRSARECAALMAPATRKIATSAARVRAARTAP